MLRVKSARKPGNVLPPLSGAAGFEPRLRSNQLSYRLRFCMDVMQPLSLAYVSNQDVCLLGQDSSPDYSITLILFFFSSSFISLFFFFSFPLFIPSTHERLYHSVFVLNVGD